MNCKLIQILSIMEAARGSTNYQLIFVELVKGVTRESIASSRYQSTHLLKGFFMSGPTWDLYKQGEIGW